MDLTTTYMGLKLKHPVVPSASPLSQGLDRIRRLEDAGAAAVVMYSLFEEQIVAESQVLDHYLTYGTETFFEALDYFPRMENFNVGPDEYLDLITQAKRAVDIPIIASLNGVSTGGWIEYAKYMEEAGADGLELNVYFIPTDPDMPGTEVRDMYLSVVRDVKASVAIPVAVKIGPFFSAFANMARQLHEAGADALVMFNRFYQPDFDLDNLEVVPNLVLSSSHELRLPLRWVAVLCGRIKADLAATSGIHKADDVLKMLMVGSRVTMMCSALLKNGIDHIRAVETDIRQWMEDHDYESIAQMQGSMCQYMCPNPSAYERAQYMRAITSYKPPESVLRAHL